MCVMLNKRPTVTNYELLKNISKKPLTELNSSAIILEQDKKGVLKRVSKKYLKTFLTRSSSAAIIIKQDKERGAKYCAKVNTHD